MSGINYDLTKIKAVVFDVDGVLSPSTIPMGDDGQPIRMVNIKDGYAIQLAAKSGIHIAIITGAKTPNLILRYQSLGVKDVFISTSKKLPVLEDWMKANGYTKEETAYMGDDIPDLPCMRAAGLPCAPFDAAIEAKDTAEYISPFSGGYGCGRDLLEQILKAQGHWLDESKAFGW